MPFTLTATPPTLSRWSEAQRYALRAASRATPSRRARSDLDPADVVLLAVLAAIPPARITVDEIARRTGLDRPSVADAIADLEERGALENGARATGRLSIVTATALAWLGLGSFGVAADFVRDDVQPAGFPVEQSADDLAEAFAGPATL